MSRYKIGTAFKVMEDHISADLGQIVYLTKDDGSTNPYFSVNVFDREQRTCISLSFLELVVPNICPTCSKHKLNKKLKKARKQVAKLEAQIKELS